MPNTTLESYINQRQNIIDTILKYKCEDGVCRVSEKELAKQINRSVTTLRKKIKEINRYDNVITESIDKYIVNIPNFRDTKQTKIYETIFIELVIKKNYKKNENELAKDLGIDRKDIQRIKTLLIGYVE